MADGFVSLKYFVSNHILPATVRVLNGFGQLEEGDEVTLESVRCVRGVEALLGRHGENPVASFLPYEYGGLFELIVASASQPWASYRGFATVGDIIKAGIEPPLAVRARKSWRGFSESDSIYQHDILTSLCVKVDATGRSYIQAINQRGTAVCLTEKVRCEFTTDLSDVHFAMEELVKLFESKFPVRVRLRAVPPVRGEYATSATVGDTFTLQRVMVRQEVAVIGNGDTFSVVADDAVDVIRIENQQDLYMNVTRSNQPTSKDMVSDDDDDYLPMAHTSVQEVQRILRKKFSEVRELEAQLSQQGSDLQNLKEKHHSLEVKLQDEHSQNVQLRARNDMLEAELQAVREMLETAQNVHRAEEITSLETMVRHLEIERDQMESQFSHLHAEVSRQQEENAQISVLEQQNYDLNERVLSLEKEKERLLICVEEAQMINKQSAAFELSHPQQTETATTTPDKDIVTPKPKPAAPPRQPSRASRSSPTPTPRPRSSRPGSNPSTPPVPVRRSVGHTMSSPGCGRQNDSASSSPHLPQNDVTQPAPPTLPRRRPVGGIN